MSGALRLLPWPDGLTVDAGIAGEFADQLNQMNAAPQDPPWCNYIVLRGQEPVGLGLFKGPPAEDGSVEIAYITFASQRGQGIATRTADMLCEIARDEGIACIRAETLPEENASTAVLEANGFERDGEGQDDEAGLIWRWKRMSGV